MPGLELACGRPGDFQDGLCPLRSFRFRMLLVSSNSERIQTILSRSHSLDSIATARPDIVSGSFNIARPTRSEAAPTEVAIVKDLMTGT